MRAFLMCAVLTVAGLTVTTASARADEWHHRHGYYGRPPVVVLRPAPVVIAPAPVCVTAAPAPVLVAQPTVVTPTYYPAPVVVGPVVRPLISLRFGIGR